MRRVCCGKVIEDVTEDVAANNVGDGNIAMPIPTIKWKDKKDRDELLRRRKVEMRSFRSFMK